MKLKGLAGVVLLLCSTTTVVLAAQGPAPQPPQATSQPATTPVNVDRLPLDLQRIERQLRQGQERVEFDGLRLQYFVPVFGKSPRIELFTQGEDLVNGPTPWGAPTHQDMLNIMTPKEFRSPVMDCSAIQRWLKEKLK